MLEEGNKVDAKTEQELLKIGNHLTATFSKLITDGFKDIKESITELFNKDIEYIKDTQKRFTSHHEEHYNNHKETCKCISEIEKKISEIVVEQKTQDKLEDKTDRKKELNMGFIVTICAVLPIISALIVYFIK